MIKCIAIPMCQSLSVLESVDYFIKRGSINFILIGDIEETKKIATENSIDLSNVQLVEESDEIMACNLSAELASQGKVQILMKGLVHTGIFLKAILNKELKLLREEGSLVSLVSRFEIPGYHKPLFITDAGINIEPELKQKAEIIKNAIYVAKSLGVKTPKVSCVCPVEVVNEKIKSTVEADLLSNMDVFGEAIVEGPLSFDVSVSAKSAEIKGVTGSVPGDADILFVPSLDVGNVLYKSLSIFGKAEIAGVIAGLKIPVVLTSRADSREVKIGSIELAMNMKL